jgi:hypothetical protein
MWLPSFAHAGSGMFPTHFNVLLLQDIGLFTGLRQP